MSVQDERREAVAGLALVDVNEVGRVLRTERESYAELREHAPPLVRDRDTASRIAAVLKAIDNIERRISEIPTYHRTR